MKKESKCRVIVTITILTIVFILCTIGIIASINSDNDQPTSPNSPTPTWSSVFGNNTPNRYVPTVNDFSLSIKISEKQCFGSAGCNVTFRVEPTYSGQRLSPSRTYELVYRIDGTVDPFIASIKIKGSNYQQDIEKFTRVKSGQTELKPIIMEVNEL